MAPDRPEIFETLGAAHRRADFVHGLVPALFPFWKGENHCKKIPELCEIGETFLGSQKIPTIAFKIRFKIFKWRMPGNRYGSFAHPTIRMRLGD